MCREAYPLLPAQEPKEWDVWLCRDEADGKEVNKVISGYPTDSGVYGPGVFRGLSGDLDGWVPLHPLWRQDQLQLMVTDGVLAKYLDPEDNSKSRFIKSLMALNLWITKWIQQPGEPVALLFLNMTGEELWLTFVMFERYKVMWDGSTKKWRSS